MQNKLKERLAKLSNKGKGNNQDSFWKPLEKDKEYQIRLIPYTHVGELHPDKNDPLIEIWTHYGIGKTNFLDPKKNAGKPSVIWDYINSLYKSGTEEDKKQAKELMPKQRFYAVVIDREDKNATPKFWGFGFNVYKFLIEHLGQADYENAMDVYEGLDLYVKQSQQKGKKFADTTCRFARKDSPLAGSAKEIQAILDAVPKIDSIFKIPSSQEVQGYFNEHMNVGVDDAEEMSGETTRGSILEEDKDVEAAFGEALANLED